VTRFLRSRVGAEASVLVEQDDRGHTEQFAEIRLDRPVPAGTLTRAAIIAADDTRLHGTLIREAA